MTYVNDADARNHLEAILDSIGFGRFVRICADIAADRHAQIQSVAYDEEEGDLSALAPENTFVPHPMFAPGTPRADFIGWLYENPEQWRELQGLFAAWNTNLGILFSGSDIAEVDSNIQTWKQEMEGEGKEDPQCVLARVPLFPTDLER